MTLATQKAYVVGRTRHPLETHSCYSVAFDSGPARAFAWQTREEAEWFYRAELDGMKIGVPALGDRLCRNFRVEERALNEFVILCDYPA